MIKGATLAFIFYVVSIAIHPAHGQTSSNRPWKLPAHTDVATMPWWDQIYQFGNFQEGIITFTTGFKATEKFSLNHNLYFGSIDMITQKGDTARLKASPEIKYIQVGSHVFFKDLHQGYIELLLQLPVSLGSVTTLNLDSSVFVSGNISGESSRLEVRGLPSVYDRYYRKRTTYFFVDSRAKLFKAIRPSLFQVFSGQREKINTYLDENIVDFTKEEDLIRLVRYCNDLMTFTPPSAENSILVKAGESFSGVAGQHNLRRFPEFLDAMITYANGSRVETKINYNLYSGEMETISEKGDTITLKKHTSINAVNVDGVVFLTGNMDIYAEVLLHAPVSLGVQRIIATIVSSDNGNKSTTTDMYYKGGSPYAVSKQDKVFVKKNHYFFIDKRNHFHPATKPSLLKLYPKQKEAIASFIREEKIDFEKENELKKLISYCIELPRQ